MRCHIVYSVPVHGAPAPLAGIKWKTKAALQLCGLPVSLIGDRGRINFDGWPETSPVSITRHLFEDFSSRMPTLLYHLREEVAADLERDDILLAHPRFPFREGFKGVAELSLSRRKKPRVAALITPLHCNAEIETAHINADYLDSVDRLLPKVDILFAIMGEYWWDAWDTSKYAHWKKKMVRVDMAVDVKYFPRVKKKFNPPGKRGFLYIGRNDAMKGTDLLAKLMSSLGDCPKGWIGGGAEIPGVPRISDARSLTPEFMGELAQQFDFFITTGAADPNPTTILESMAWGFPVVCTPQSGYYETSYMKNVFSGDLDRSLAVLNGLQSAGEGELMAMADEARNAVEKTYNWDRFLCAVRGTLDKMTG